MTDNAISMLSVVKAFVHSDRNLHTISVVFFTARKRSLGQGNIFSSVCQKFCPRGVVCLSACWDTTHTPLARRPPPLLARRLPLVSQPPLAKRPPPARRPPYTVHAGRYGQQSGSMHPTGMHSCLTERLLLFGTWSKYSGVVNTRSKQDVLARNSSQNYTFEFSLFWN